MPAVSILFRYLPTTSDGHTSTSSGGYLPLQLSPAIVHLLQAAPAGIADFLQEKLGAHLGIVPGPVMMAERNLELVAEEIQ